MPGTNTNKPTDLAAKHGVADKAARWIDFSAYGMSMKLGIFTDARAIVMEGGDRHPGIVEALGFVKIGDDWIREEIGFQPREFIKIASDAVMRKDMPVNDILVERDDYIRPLIADATSSEKKRAFSSRVAAAASTGTSSDLVSLLGAPETTRWMDFSAYGMSLKRVAYADSTVLVMEGGDAHQEMVTALGFAKEGDDWIREDLASQPIRPISFRAIAPEMSVDRHTPIRDIQVDRTDRHRPITHWFASFETGGNEVQAFGATPEAAVASLADAWSELAEIERIDQDLLGKFREGISVVPFVSGKAYAKGIGDRNWYKGGLNGDDPRFDQLLPGPTPGHDRAPGYR